jgi:hypothetical protein
MGCKSWSYKPFLLALMFGALPLHSKAKSVIYINQDTFKQNPKIINESLMTLEGQRGPGLGNGGSVILEAGTFVINEPIYLPENTSLIGQGRFKTKIEKSTNFPPTEPTIIVGGKNSVIFPFPHQALDNEISGIELSAGSLPGGTGIRIESGQDVRVRHNTIVGHDMGIVLDGGARHSISNNILKDQKGVAIQITSTLTDISTSHYIDGNQVFNSAIGISLECIETGFITNNLFDNMRTNSISIRRLPQNDRICGGGSIISGVSIFKNQFIGGPSTADSQIHFKNGYSFPINFSIVDNYFSGGEKSIHAIQADANGASPNIRSLVVTGNTFLSHRKAPIKLSGALGFNISSNVFADFGSGSVERGNSEHNSGIWLIGGRAGCGGTTRAGMVAGNLFKPKEPLNLAVGWAILSACMMADHSIKLSENELVDGLSGSSFLAGGDITQNENIMTSSAQETILKSKTVRPVVSSLPDFASVLNVAKCTQTQEILDGDDVAQKINQSLNKMGQTGGGVLCVEPGHYWIKNTIKLPSNTSLLGQGAFRTEFYRKGNFGPTIKFAEGGQNQTVAGIFFHHLSDIGGPFQPKPLDNLVSETTSHILVNNSENVTIEDSWLWRLPMGIRFRGGRNIKVHGAYFSGMNDSQLSSLQEGLSEISLEDANGLSPTNVNINFNFFAGMISEKRLINWGQGRIVDPNTAANSYAHNNIGPLRGVFVSSLKTGDISFNYIGGLGNSDIEIAPKKSVSGLNISGNYFDGATEAQINLKTGEVVATDIGIEGNHFFAALNNLYGIKLESRGVEVLADRISISGNTFIDHIANPIKLTGAHNFSIANNVFESFNSLGRFVVNDLNKLTYGDYGAAIFLVGSGCGYATSVGTVKANLFDGGHFQSPDDSTYGINGVLSHCYSGINPGIGIKGNMGQVRKGQSLLKGDIQGN